VRIAFAFVVLLAALPVAQGFAIAEGLGGIHPTAPPSENETVIATQPGHLLLYDENGTLQYDEHRYENYWDVDPSPVGDRTVLLAAGADAENCGADDCVRNIVTRINLTTGERVRLFSRTVSTKGSAEWHDVDRINDSALVVADIKHDKVFMIDPGTKEVFWQWNASEHFSRESGGPPKDWTHLNDVEYTENGRVMASIRNQDQVVFIEPGEGVVENRTLGAEDDFSVLWGQHNPDYIPEIQGGPAILVADSHNDRAVEYQWREDEWVRTWQWSDERTQWIRDADRLPGRETLITDTNGDRVLEVNESGGIVWSVSIEKPYEAERLGTGDESSTGKSAAALGLRSRTGGHTRTVDTLYGFVSVHVWQAFTDVAPPFALNSVLFVVPKWMGPTEILPLVVAGLTALLWVGTEMYWRSALSAIRTRLERA
jgi:hypothetical protein